MQRFDRSRVALHVLEKLPGRLDDLPWADPAAITVLVDTPAEHRLRSEADAAGDRTLKKQKVVVVAAARQALIAAEMPKEIDRYENGDDVGKELRLCSVQPVAHKLGPLHDRLVAHLVSSGDFTT